MAAEPAPARHPVADMGTDIEGKPTLAHEPAIEPVETRRSPGNAVVDDERAYEPDPPGYTARKRFGLET